MSGIGTLRVNYLRYASLYLEQMRRLSIDHPEIRVMFMSEQFVVQKINESFNAVSPDVKLEQSIQQRSQKSVHGIIGQTRKSKYVTEWEVAYHEILSINYVSHPYLFKFWITRVIPPS